MTSAEVYVDAPPIRKAADTDVVIAARAGDERRERVSAAPPHDSPGAVAGRRRALARATEDEP